MELLNLSPIIDVSRSALVYLLVACVSSMHVPLKILSNSILENFILAIVRHVPGCLNLKPLLLLLQVSINAMGYKNQHNH